MSTQAEKFLAKQELEKRRMERALKWRHLIENKSDGELEEILSEPDDEEEV